MNNMMGININCKHQDFIDEILTGLKTIETRQTNSLKPYVCKRVGLIKTGCGQATLMGYATITSVVVADSPTLFRKYENQHRIAQGSPYDIKTIKYLYELTDVERCEPKEIYTKGIVARQI